MGKQKWGAGGLGEEGNANGWETGVGSRLTDPDAPPCVKFELFKKNRRAYFHLLLAEI